MSKREGREDKGRGGRSDSGRGQSKISSGDVGRGSNFGAKPAGGKAAGSHRTQRAEREIREVIGAYLISGFRGELPGFISVSRVIVSSDVRNAKVLVTAHTPTDERPPGFERAIVKELAAHAHEIQHEVNRLLRMKNTPRLTFFYDTGAEASLKIDNILHALSEERAKKEKSEPESEDN